MNSKLYELKEYARNINNILLNSSFAETDDVNGFKTVKNLFNQTIPLRNNIISLMANFDRSDYINAISFCLNIWKNDVLFREDLFKRSFLSFCIYEIVMYSLSSYLTFGNYDIINDVVLQKYYENNGFVSNVINFYEAITFTTEMILYLRSITDDIAENKVIRYLVETRNTVAYSSIEELTSLDIILCERSKIEQQKMFPFVSINYIVSNKAIPVLASYVFNMLKNEENSVYVLFGENDFVSLFAKCKSLEQPAFKYLDAYIK